MNIAIVGAGLSGATLANKLSEAGHKVTVFESRNHIAGNAYDHIDEETGIRIHDYGPHIFHTKSKEVFEYLSRFTNIIPYEHRVGAWTGDHLVPFPPNAETLKFYPKETLIDIFYRPYTELMWARPLEEVAPSILNRVPIREDNEDRYFPNDPYQGMPDQGYTAMVSEMLKKSTVLLNTAFTKEMCKDYDQVFYCGSVDTFYDYVLGRLSYRSIKFIHAKRSISGSYVTTNYAGSALKNRTRYTTWTGFPNDYSSKQIHILTAEEPCFDYENNGERYYPIRTDSTLELFNLYKLMLEKDYPNVHLIGRCGNYVYIDMDQAVNMALRAAEKFQSVVTGGRTLI